MRRREFLTAFGSTVSLVPVAASAWTSAARAQQAMPVIGFLRNTAPDDAAQLVAAFRNGLQETGFVEGRNVRVEYRWTGGRTEQLPAMAVDLVAHKVNVIVALGNTTSVRAAKAATSTIPVVFMLGTDPVQLGLVASLHNPGGNVTGVVNLNLQLAQKWVEVRTR